jgi:acyl transferase domain-containing protein
MASSTTSLPLYLFVISGHTESAISRWRTSLTNFYQGELEDHILRSVSYNLARQSRSCAVRSFGVGPTISSDIIFSEPVITDPKMNPKLCLCFSGQGPQHIAMGRELCASYPVFLASIKQSDEILVVNYVEESFLERTGLFLPNKQAKLATNAAWPVEDVIYSIVFMQLALVDLIRSLGIEYDYVVGHRCVFSSLI